LLLKMANRKKNVRRDKKPYRERNRIECAIGNVKINGAVAIRLPPAR